MMSPAQARASRALEEWYANKFYCLSPTERQRLAADVASIMAEERVTSITAVMLLDLRIHPAPLHSYVKSLR